MTTSVAGETGVPAYHRVRGHGRALPKRSTKPSFKLQDDQNDQADGRLKKTDLNCVYTHPNTCILSLFFPKNVLLFTLKMLNCCNLSVQI